MKNTLIRFCFLFSIAHIMLSATSCDPQAPENASNQATVIDGAQQGITQPNPASDSPTPADSTANDGTTSQNNAINQKPAEQNPPENEVAKPETPKEKLIKEIEKFPRDTNEIVKQCQALFDSNDTTQQEVNEIVMLLAEKNFDSLTTFYWDDNATKNAKDKLKAAIEQINLTEFQKDAIKNYALGMKKEFTGKATEQIEKIKAYYNSNERCNANLAEMFLHERIFQTKHITATEALKQFHADLEKNLKKYDEAQHDSTKGQDYNNESRIYQTQNLQIKGTTLTQGFFINYLISKPAAPFITARVEKYCKESKNIKEDIAAKDLLNAALKERTFKTHEGEVGVTSEKISEDKPERLKMAKIILQHGGLKSITNAASLTNVIKELGIDAVTLQIDTSTIEERDEFISKIKGANALDSKTLRVKLEDKGVSVGKNEPLLMMKIQQDFDEPDFPQFMKTIANQEPLKKHFIDTAFSRGKIIDVIKNHQDYGLSKDDLPQIFKKTADRESTTKSLDDLVKAITPVVHAIKTSTGNNDDAWRTYVIDSFGGIQAFVEMCKDRWGFDSESIYGFDENRHKLMVSLGASKDSLTKQEEADFLNAVKNKTLTKADAIFYSPAALKQLHKALATLTEEEQNDFYDTREILHRPSP